MAKIEIKSAFVEPWSKNTEEHPAWGMKTAEPHSRKRADGTGYDTVGRTFRTVKVSRESGIDLAVFAKGQRVQIWGSEVTETREHEGKKYFDLIVWADRVEIAEGSQATAADSGASTSGFGAAPNGETPDASQDVWATPGSSEQFPDEVPF